jgi:hypothetical protein
VRSEPPLTFVPSRFSDLPLDLLIDRIDGTLGDDAGWIISFRGLHRALELGFRPLAGEHPVDALLGETFPPDVDALGVAVTGTARSLDPGPLTDEDVPSGRVRILQVHARDGRAASRLREVGGKGRRIDGRAADGDVADCLRRALGLPTPPPAVPPRVWWAVEWLDAVLEAVCADPARRWAWAHVARLHPRAGVLPPDRPAALVELVARDAASLDWAALRADAAAGGSSSCPIGPELAAWMDDGMFARWLIGSRPDPVEVVADLVELLAPPVVRGVVEALQAWGCW